MAEHLPDLAELEACGQAIVDADAHRPDPGQDGEQEHADEAHQVQQQADARHDGAADGVRVGSNAPQAGTLHAGTDAHDDGGHKSDDEREH